MDRYSIGASEDAYEPGSGGRVLRNRMGLRTVEEIDRTEAALLVVAQARSYRQIETTTQFDVAVLRTLHRSWLGPLYAFAGEFRRVDLSKDGFMFAPLAYLENSLAELDRVLRKHTPCASMSFDTLVVAIARVHAEFLLVHPFREGNGRLSRWLADLMALQAGLPPLQWGFETETEARRNVYFAALRRGYALDLRPLESLVREALERALDSAEDPAG